MRRPDKAGGSPVKAHRRKEIVRRKTAKVAGRRKSSTVDAADRIAVLTIERDEALEQQRATSEVLKVISSSAGELQLVFKAMLECALRICEAKFGMLMLYRSGDGSFDTPVMVGAPPALVDALLHQSFTPPPGNPLDRMLRTKKTVHVVDAAAERAKPLSAQLAGARAHISVPMLRENEVVGSISIYRTEVRPFTDRQIELVTNFADQAVIAIENARLFNEVQEKTRELTEALTYQTGSSNILSVIASSPTDVSPVLQAIAESACALCGAYDAVALLKDGDDLVFGAHHGPIPVEMSRLPISRNWTPGLAVIEQRPVHIHDLLSSEGDQVPEAQRRASEFGYRTILSVPMLREKESIGVLALRRAEAHPFSDKQIALLQTFADQAVIAIGNVRMFEQVQERTKELTEALEQQTATSEVLRVISVSPGELEPVFQAILANAVRLCEAKFAMLFLYDERENEFHAVGKWNLPPAWSEFLEKNRLRADPRVPLGRVVATKQPVQIADVLADAAYIGGYQPGMVAVADLGGARTLVQVPMLRENQLVGSLGIYRQEVRPFTDKQIALVRDFAAQAVIAIGNVRMFEQVQERTKELTEALEQQTATSEVLRVISVSPGELEPVFQAMLANAVRLCQAEFAMLFLYDEKENKFRPVGRWNLPLGYDKFLEKNTISFDPRTPVARATITKQPVQVADILLDQSYTIRHPGIVAVAEEGGARTLLQVPMLKENHVVGSLGIYRQEVRPFTDKQIALVRNFAAQAVIAIENARLLNELRQRTDDLTASLENLRTAQDRLVQTQKLASLGQLTAGIAHEIKNPLNFVNNFSALSAELVGEMNEVLAEAALDQKTRGEMDELAQMLKSNLEKVVQHGKRANSIVKNMLLHSREGSGEHRPADINAIVDESLNLAYHGARAEKAGFNIALERDFDLSSGMADVYPQEITRVLLNLISNGFYATTKRAIEAGDGFKPTLSAATRNLGDRIEIRIRDNGTGIPQEVREKIFNPFFTTKPAGEGTGLGLSMSHDIIVKQHGGTIEVDTEPGQFTEFRIILPRAGQG